MEGGQGRLEARISQYPSDLLHSGHVIDCGQEPNIDLGKNPSNKVTQNQIDNEQFNHIYIVLGS
jgi:hypothetical protein